MLLVGDSHTVGTFGRTLDALLRTLPAEAATYASCGSSPEWWFSGHSTPCGYFQNDLNGHATTATQHPTPLLADLVAEVHPTVVVAALGANLVNASLDVVAAQSEKLAQAIHGAGARCIWVGPPHGRNKPEPGFSRFYEALEKAVSPDCAFVDSRPYTHYPDQGGDGIHYDSLGEPGKTIARAWAKSVSNDIEKILQEP